MKAARTTRHLWPLAVITAVLVQSMYPAGYMPAAADDSWPVMLCPDGMPADLVLPGHGAHRHHGESSGEAAATDSCPVGKAFESQAMPAAKFSATQLCIITDIPVSAPDRTAPVLRLPTGFCSRAPPPSPSV